MYKVDDESDKRWGDDPCVDVDMSELSAGLKKGVHEIDTGHALPNPYSYLRPIDAVSGDRVPRMWAICFPLHLVEFEPLSVIGLLQHKQENLLFPNNRNYYYNYYKVSRSLLIIISPHRRSMSDRITELHELLRLCSMESLAMLARSGILKSGNRSSIRLGVNIVLSAEVGSR